MGFVHGLDTYSYVSIYLFVFVVFLLYSFIFLAVDLMYEQADGTYAHNIEKLVRKVCALAREKGEEHQSPCLRASSLQCLTAMVVL